ncbi:MAG: hypothetical protein Q4F97_00190 [Bacteroidales bacterium]|nr:hypothetical protein [Bacteroidales bacterium]
MRNVFFAIEEVTLELDGWIEANKLDFFKNDGITPIVIDNRVPIRLILSRQSNILSKFFPFLRLNYNEAVWKIGINKDSNNSWLLYRSIIDKFFPRIVFSNIYNFHVNKGDFVFMEKRKSLITSFKSFSNKRMKCHVELGEEKLKTEESKPIYIRKKDGISLIPIKKSYPEFRRASRADIIKDDLSEVLFNAPIQWETNCIVHRGQTTKNIKKNSSI